MGWAQRSKAHPERTRAPAIFTAQRLVALADRTHPLRARRWRRIFDPEESLDAPDHAANRRSDNGADRACDAKAFPRAMLEAARKTTLGLDCDRSRHGDDDDACKQ